MFRVSAHAVKGAIQQLSRLRVAERPDILAREPAAEHFRAERRNAEAIRLLAHKRHEPDRMAEPDARLAERLQDLCRHQHAERAVITAAIRHGVVMRAEQDGLPPRLRPLCALAPEVGNRVQPHAEAELAAPAALQPRAGLHVRRTRELAVDAALLIRADARERFEPLQEPPAIHMNLHHDVSFSPLTL